jgi:hypothetical protein
MTEPNKGRPRVSKPTWPNPFKKADPRNGWYMLTVELATWLLSTQPPQRFLRERKAQRFAKAMLQREWQPTGQPIILDENGLLLDGQGRCRACQISGLPFPVYVIFDGKRSHFPNLDLGEARSGANTLEQLGVKHANLIAAVSRWAILIEDLGRSASYQREKIDISNATIKKYYEEHASELAELVSRAGEIAPRWRNALSGRVSPSVLLYVVYAARRISPEMADSFLEGVLTGAELKKDSPALLLREAKASRGKLTSYEEMALAIKAMNLHLQRKTAKFIKWTAGIESFPHLIAVAEEQ